MTASGLEAIAVLLMFRSTPAKLDHSLTVGTRVARLLDLPKRIVQNASPNLSILNAESRSTSACGL